jgi:hypothetical protein
LLGSHLVYRSLIFSFVYGPPVPVTRKDASSFNESISELLPHASFKYSPPKAPDNLDFKVEIQQQEGRRREMVLVDVFQGALRFLGQQDFPESSTIAYERADEMHKAMSELASSTTVQMVEVRIRAQLGTQKPSALKYLVESVLGEKAKRVSELGNVNLLGLKYEVSPKDGASSPLDAPARQVVIEPLRDEQSSLYVEVMSKWGRVRATPVQGQPGTVRASPDGPLNVGVLEPSKYFEEVSAYVSGSICGFVGGGKA